MMNMVQACGAVAKLRSDDSLLAATMGAMFAFDRIEAEGGKPLALPPADGQARLVIGPQVAGPIASAQGGADAALPLATISRISSVPLMGGAAGIGLGLALAQPQRQVIVVDGDASLLLELSGLVTVASAAPANLIHVVIKNGRQFTGLANLHAPAQSFSFAEAARNAGYRSAQTIADGVRWAETLAQLLKTPGPHFVELLVEPMPQRAGAGFEQTELPDQQFERMGREALAVQQFLKAGAG
jgi:Thiamine pyrophosphate enzyme, C-terminal TPP binding domain